MCGNFVITEMRKKRMSPATKVSHDHSYCEEEEV